MVKVLKMDFPGVNGWEKRNTYIYLPKSYGKSDKRYPVLYMFDGHNVFFDSHATYGKSWGLKQYLDKKRIDLLVVAVECNHGHDNERMYEYCPFPFVSSFQSDRGYEPCADTTLDWYANVLKPYVDKHYQTNPDREHTFLGGSSMGGLMASYGLVLYNDIYSKAMAMSPAYYVCKNYSYDFYKNLGPLLPSEMYTDYGTNDIKPKASIRLFHQVNRFLERRNVAITERVILNGDHSEANWEKQLPIAISALMYNLD